MGKRQALAMLGRSHWAITQQGLREMLLAVSGKRPKPRAIGAAGGNHLSGTSATTVRDGIATIPVAGPLTRYDDWYLALFGWTSYEGLARDLRVALAAPEVRAVVLAINSHGGEVDGAHECSRAVFGSRGEKPIVAHVADHCCSAAFWVAAAADEVIGTPTSLVGCLGTQFETFDDTGFLAQMGFKRITILSPQTPKKNPDPATPEGEAAWTALAAGLADVFLDDVAAYRDVDRAGVAEEYGQGQVFVGTAAVEAGLVDRLMTSEELHAELVQQLATPARGSAGASAQRKEPPMPEPTTVPQGLTAEAIAAAYPAFVATWREAGATAERERIIAIEKLVRPGLEKLIGECKADPKVSAGDAAVRILEADAAKRAGQLTALQANETTGDLPPDSPPPADEPGSDEAVAKRVLATHRRVTGATTDRAPAQRS